MHLDLNTFAAITGSLLGLIGATVGSYIGLMRTLRNINFDTSLTDKERWKQTYKTVKILFNTAILTIGLFFFQTVLIVFCKANEISNSIYMFLQISITAVYVALILLLAKNYKETKTLKL